MKECDTKERKGNLQKKITEKKMNQRDQTSGK